MFDQELETISVELLAETDKAVLVVAGDIETWLPKSQIDLEDNYEVGAQVIEITAPLWLLEQSGLV